MIQPGFALPAELALSDGKLAGLHHRRGCLASTSGIVQDKENPLQKDAIQLYAVRKKNGTFIKRGLGLAWTADLTEVRLYARLRDAQSRITLMRNLGLRKTRFEVVAFALVGPVEVISAKAGSK